MYVSEVFVEKVLTEIRRGWGTDLRRGWGLDSSRAQKAGLKLPTASKSKRKRVVSSPKLAGTGAKRGAGQRRGSGRGPRGR